jgi:F-type H+-transporting ATPase subunit c
MNRKYALFLLAVIALCVFAPAAFAQGQPAGGQGGGLSLSAIAAGFGMAIASAGCGLAQGRASAGASEAFARNPGAAKVIQNMFILAMVLIESMALYTFAVVFLKVK